MMSYDLTVWHAVPVRGWGWIVHPPSEREIDDMASRLEAVSGLDIKCNSAHTAIMQPFQFHPPTTVMMSPAFKQAREVIL